MSTTSETTRKDGDPATDENLATTEQPTALDSLQTPQQLETATLIENLMGANEWVDAKGPNGETVSLKSGYGFLAHTAITVTQYLEDEAHNKNLPGFPRTQRTTFEIAKNGAAIVRSVIVEYVANGREKPKKHEVPANITIDLIPFLKSLTIERKGGTVSAIKAATRRFISFFDGVPTPLVNVDPLNPTFPYDEVGRNPEL